LLRLIQQAHEHYKQLQPRGKPSRGRPLFFDTRSFFLLAVVLRSIQCIPAGVGNIDTGSRWFKSGYRGQVQGYRLVLQGLVFPQPVPLFATWAMNDVGAATVVKAALAEARLPVMSVLLSDETIAGHTVDYSLSSGRRLFTDAQTVIRETADEAKQLHLMFEINSINLLRDKA
jgi:hypothetical protein